MRASLPRRLRMVSRWLAIACVCLMFAARAASAQVQVQAAAPAAEGALKTVSREQYAARIRQGQELLESCRGDVKRCDPKQVGEDVQVAAGGGAAAFEMRWDWLRQTLHAAPEAKGPARDALFRNAQQRLRDEADEAGAAAAAPDVSQAEARAQAILEQRQFRHVQQTSWLQERLGDLELWISRLFGSFRNLLPSSSWIGVALEWGILAVAAVGLGFWAWTTTRQQRVAIAAGSSPTQLWQVESERWAERAETEAGRGDWREAVHCLYWSAIVMLEGQRLWRPNRTRTPREYVRLLEPGSARARSLGSLTGVFERIWYGLRAAERTDYEQARGLLEQLRAA